MSCRHDLALTTCMRCYPATGTIAPGPECDYAPNLDGPGAVTMSDTLTKIAEAIKSAEETRTIKAKLADAKREAMIAPWVKWLRETLPGKVYDALVDGKSYLDVPSEGDDFFEACKREGVKVDASRGLNDTTQYIIRIIDLKKAVGAV